MTRIWHGATAALIAFALIGQTVIGIDEGRSLVNLFSYFTIQSNILILIAAVAIALRPGREGTAWWLLRLAGLVGITVTGIVYGGILAGTTSFEGFEWWFDKIFHYGAPILAMLGFFLFTPRTRFAWRALAFVAWPVAWLAYTLIRGEAVHPRFQIKKGVYSDVPYGFLDANIHGVGGVVVNSIGVTVLMLGIAALYVKFSSREIVSAR